MFSKFFLSLNISKKVAYAALFLALAVVANTVLDIDITPQNKITFTYLVTFLSAYALGALPAFFIAFAGDGLGHLIMPDGSYWFYGLTLALMGFTMGMLLRYLPFRGKRAPYIKTAIVCAVCYVLFTVCINTLGNYTYVWVFVWQGEMRKSLWLYLAGYFPPRIAIQTAVFAGNAAVCFAMIPLMERLSRHGEAARGATGGEEPPRHGGGETPQQNKEN